ncbi:MAG: hypothetical protein Q7R70_01715 [Candidatus Diapherotrites archaeon]|nr:hypothetical protein [Candidatus Diapherotrites archaeon]
MKPEIPQKVKRVVSGWTQPSKQKAKALRQSAESIVAKFNRKENEKIRVLDPTIQESRFGAYRTASMNAEEANLKRREILSKTAAKFALDSIGLSSNGKEGLARRKIQNAIQRIAFVQESRIAGKQDMISSQNQQKRILEEIRKELGNAKFGLFMKRYTQVLKKLKSAV